MADRIPDRPAVHRVQVFTPEPGVRWDPDLTQVRIEKDLVMGLACGYIKPLDLQDGDTYYKLVDAAFIDEEQARGRHTISVDVVDEQGRRINGARVWHGWPTGKLPEWDDRVQATIFGAQIAEWALYEKFDAWRDPGPYWVQPADGKADLFWGAGLPWGRHVCFSLVFQRTTYRAEPVMPPVEPPIQPPTGALAELLIKAGEIAQVIRFNPDAALQKRIFADGFVPNSPEFEVEYDGARYVAQRAEHMGSGEVRVYYCKDGNWSNVLCVVRK
jgi:hypothetical protein